MNATMNDLSRTPRRRIGDLVTPLGPDGKLEPGGSFFQRGASDIYRDQGERLIAIKFDIHGRDLAGAVAEAQQKCKDLVSSTVPPGVERRVPGNGAGRAAADDRHSVGFWHGNGTAVPCLPLVDRRLHRVV